MESGDSASLCPRLMITSLLAWTETEHLTCDCVALAETSNDYLSKFFRYFGKVLQSFSA